MPVEETLVSCLAGGGNERANFLPIFFARLAFDSGADIDSPRLQHANGVRNVLWRKTTSDDDSRFTLQAGDELVCALPIEDLARSAALGFPGFRIMNNRVEQETVNAVGGQEAAGNPLDSGGDVKGFEDPHLRTATLAAVAKKSPGKFREFVT